MPEVPAEVGEHLIGIYPLRHPFIKSFNYKRMAQAMGCRVFFRCLPVTVIVQCRLKQDSTPEHETGFSGLAPGNAHSTPLNSDSIFPL